VGPLIVMVHGLGGNLCNLCELIDRLAATFRVVAVDSPGSGLSVLQSVSKSPTIVGYVTVTERIC
jgi:pimeloyl-ACP methyl ester carboxylesterase